MASETRWYTSRRLYITIRTNWSHTYVNVRVTVVIQNTQYSKRSRFINASRHKTGARRYFGNCSWKRKVNQFHVASVYERNPSMNTHSHSRLYSIVNWVTKLRGTTHKCTQIRTVWHYTCTTQCNHCMCHKYLVLHYWYTIHMYATLRIATMHHIWPNCVLNTLPHKQLDNAVHIRTRDGFPNTSPLSHYNRTTKVKYTLSLQTGLDACVGYYYVQGEVLRGVRPNTDQYW